MMEKSKLTTVGSVVAAIVASLCCIGPVAVAFIGVGSLGAFAVFETYRPYLIGVTVILLGLAFYLTYRKREVLCEDGTCKIEGASKWNKIAVWLVTVFAAGAIVFPYFDFTNKAVALAILSQQSQQPVNSAIAILDIQGMDCKGCAKGLEATLGRVEGVKTAAVDFEESRAVVEYDPGKVKPQNLVASVNETGFKATLRSSKAQESSVKESNDY